MARTVSQTSWTRTTWAPFATASVPAAILPERRSPGSPPPNLSMNDSLEPRPTSVGFGVQAANHRTEPPTLIIRTHGIGTGSSRFNAHVEAIGPVFHPLATMAEGLIRIEVATTLREGIGGDVEDPHHARPV